MGKKVYSTNEDTYKEQLELWEFDITKKHARMISSTSILRDGDKEIPARVIEGPITIYEGTILGTLAAACDKSVKGQSRKGFHLYSTAMACRSSEAVPLPSFRIVEGIIRALHSIHSLRFPAEVSD